MKFKTDQFGERTLTLRDDDGDRLRVVISEGIGFTAAVDVNMSAVLMGRKKLRKFAKAILKETRK